MIDLELRDRWRWFLIAAYEAYEWWDTMLYVIYLRIRRRVLTFIRRFGFGWGFDLF